MRSSVVVVWPCLDKLWLKVPVAVDLVDVCLGDHIPVPLTVRGHTEKCLYAPPVFCSVCCLDRSRSTCEEHAYLQDSPAMTPPSGSLHMASDICSA